MLTLLRDAAGCTRSAGVKPNATLQSATTATMALPDGEGAARGGVSRRGGRRDDGSTAQRLFPYVLVAQHPGPNR